MTNPNDLVLHEDARIIPLSDISAKMRGRMPESSGGYVLSRPGSRNGSMVIDDQGARLVKLLADGMLLTDALRQLAAEAALSPELVAREAYSLIRALIDRNYLRKRDNTKKTSSSDGARPRFRPNDVFQGHTIIRCVHFLEDTEIYQIRLKQGGVAALKILREAPKTVLEAFKREALILERLQGGVGPKLIDSQLVGETKFLIMEWIDGMQSHLWAARVTRLDPRERHSEMLCLCKEIVKAYAMLHGQGVLHSDIYSKNVLMCRDGSARLVDFGYSFHDEVDAIVGQSRRNCNPYFKSPDLARRDISDKKVAQPSPTVASEIYSIGALLYYLVTGSTYIDFSLQQSAIDVQICSSAMVPFAQRGIVGFDVLEGIIAKMLAKEPGDRYASLAECLSDLNNVTAEYSPVGLDVRQLSLDDAPTLKSLATVTIPPPLAAPSASVNYGGAGIALALLKAAHALDDASLIQAADLWAAYANVWMEAGPEGRLNEKMGITSQALGPYAILHSIEGIWLVQALVAHGQLDSVSLRGLCLKFLAGMHKREAPLEFIFGKAGMLNAILQISFLVKENEPLVRIGNELVADMMKEISSATNFEQSSVQVLGFAHGWAGILYPLLAWGRRYDAELVARVVPLLERLAAYKVDTRLGSFWPHRFDRPIDQGDMAGWCNGTAGFILLWGEAYLATGDSRWLSLARDAARHCMTYLENNNSVCCGLAGRGYALAILGAISGEEEWERAAQRCLQQEAAGTPDIALHPHSLFKGVLGHELARLEVLKREGIAFPMLASDMYGEPLPVGQLS